MTQHIPPINVDRNPAVEAAAKMKDVTDRARAARPVDQGADILKGNIANEPVKGYSGPIGLRIHDIL